MGGTYLYLNMLNPVGSIDHSGSMIEHYLNRNFSKSSAMLNHFPVQIKFFKAISENINLSSFYPEKGHLGNDS